MIPELNIIGLDAHSRRVTLGQARTLRDRLEKEIQEERPLAATEVTAIAINVRDARKIYHKLRPHLYRKRKLDALYEVGCFIAALETKGARR